MVGQDLFPGSKYAKFWLTFNKVNISKVNVTKVNITEVNSPASFNNPSNPSNPTNTNNFITVKTWIILINNPYNLIS